MRWDRPEALSQAERLKLKRLALNALTFGPCWVNLIEVSKHVDPEAEDWRTRVRNPPPPPHTKKQEPSKSLFFFAFFFDFSFLVLYKKPCLLLWNTADYCP